MYALDALFGLPREKSAGVSCRPPTLGKLFFCDQELVDELEAELNKSFKYVDMHILQ